MGSRKESEHLWWDVRPNQPTLYSSQMFPLGNSNVFPECEKHVKMRNRVGDKAYLISNSTFAPPPGNDIASGKKIKRCKVWRNRFRRAGAGLIQILTAPFPPRLIGCDSG